jgi:hypothetical protein
MKLLFSIAFIIFCKPSSAQIDIVSESVNHRDSNVLFIGVDNILILKGANGRPYVLTANNAEILKLDGKFLLRLYNQNNTILKLYKNKKLVLTKTFRVEVVSRPKAQLGAITDTTASISEILANPFLQVVTPNSTYKHEYSVFDFALDVITSENDTLWKSAYMKGNFITDQKLKIIRELHLNDQLHFHNIRVTCPGCRIFIVPPLTIKIE